MRIVLIGPRGSGKSSIGRRLAARLDVPFIDLDDHVLTYFAEGSVTEVWSAHGEPAWRAAEARAVREIFAGATGAAVIALGGGAPMIEVVQAILKAEREAGRAKVVYLCAEPRVLARRLADEPGDRPSLTGGTIDGEAARVLAQREPTYRALADHIIDTATDTLETIAARIADAIGG